MKRDNSPRAGGYEERQLTKTGRYERDSSQKQVDMKRDNSPRAGRYEERQLTKSR